MNARVFKRFSGKWEYIPPGRVISTDADGFDTVTATILYNGKADALLAEFRPGGTAPCPVAGGDMICFGPSSNTELPGNVTEATIQWRGILSMRNSQRREITYTVSETSHDSVSGIPGTTGSVRARILEIQKGYRIQYVYRGAGPPPGPVLNYATGEIIFQAAGQPPPGPNYTTMNPFTVVYPYGWIPVNVSHREALPGIWFCSEDRVYERRYQPG